MSESELTTSELREIESSHFMAIAQALISGANDAQCEAVKNLLFWRQRELRAEQVRRFSPGEEIEYLLADSKTRTRGTIHHLNKLSVSIHMGNGQYKAIPVERIVNSTEWEKLFKPVEG
jgi:hypothetical protein